MTDEQLKTAAFVFTDELSAWKIVKFDWDNYHAIRKCGEVHAGLHESEAHAIPKRRAAKALIAFYHKEMASS